LARAGHVARGAGERLGESVIVFSFKRAFCPIIAHSVDSWPRLHAEETALIEVISPPLGVEVEASDVSLLGRDYDPKSNAFKLALAEVDHVMYYPTEIAVIDEDDGFISAVEVTRVYATQEIVQVRRSGVLALNKGARTPP
jgi:hypothetical protein